ncbi:MAG: LCP family protein [Clostridia bacterium]|nr:LCP family protein [Clostridia bacterium]
MKRILALLLAAVMLLPCLCALADTPKPIEVIPYDQLPETRDGMHHYLLLCVDQWRSNPSNLGNSDGIMILTLDTRANRIMLTSLIRDALVVRPDGVIGRVNYIAKNYSPEALCKVLSEHLGIRIEKYVLFDFQQIANIVDYMGGVEITVDASEARYLREYPLDAHQTEPKMNRAGTYLFTGRAAVIYMRIRKAGGGGDFTRTQRARTVLSTLADKCRVMTYDQARDLVDIVAANTTMTNMTLEDMVYAMELAYSLRSCVIEELRIPQEDAVSPISYAGMSVQEIDWIKSREDVADYMECSWLVIDDEEYDD